ncbi:M64 family metallopeptidase [Kitasatospora sp. NPDC048540]|uniref:M64 family metallopeptidase n=1 Tax=unclassified Kitasatospora TaxID=2633591 RepID=UPI00053AA97E|nr:M64 family metallopeptidase [Kitasatospora sp. MBT63]
MRRARLTALALAGVTAVAALSATTTAAAAPGPSSPGPSAAAGAAPAGAAAAGTAAARSHEVEAFGEDGSISRARVPGSSPFAAPKLAAPRAAGDGTVTPVVHNGSTAAKLDVVVIGDGYTAAEQDKFHADAATKWQEITAVEPYRTYRALFNVWTVDAVSAESGASGDPDRTTVRNTALGSYFWCEDIERLLCVDTDAVDRYAAKAPQADLVIVVANTAKYGGAGYNDIVSPLGYSGIATVAGGNDRSGQIAVHETGHSLGKLADEYFYDGGGTYQGDEPAEANTTTLTAADLRRTRTKWYRWLGRPSPDGGTVGTYEGAGYYPSGLYRPTDNSIMRSLGREFNLPGREAMIAGFYRYASPLASDTPAGTVLHRGDRLTVQLPAPGTRLRWYLDGREVRGLRDRATVRIADLDLAGPRFLHHCLTAVATDPTDAVIDPELRTALTDAVTWQVTR